MEPYYLGFICILVAGIALWTAIWRTRDRTNSLPSSGQMMNRHLRLSGGLVIYVLTVITSSILLVQQDSAWEQKVLVYSSTLPIHLALYFVSMPAYLAVGGGAYLYTRTRLPEFARKHRVSFLIAVLTPFTFLPETGVSEGNDVLKVILVTLYWLAVIMWLAAGVGRLLHASANELAGLMKPGTPEIKQP